MDKSRLRKALASKQRRTSTYQVPVEDSTGAAEALGAAEGELRLALIRHEADAPEVVAARAKVTEAKQALDDCFYSITFQNLPPDAFEALISAHEPTEKQKKDGAHFNLDTLMPALIAACAAEQELTEAEWAEELRSKRWSAAERNELFDVAMSVNTRGRSQSVPFG